MIIFPPLALNIVNRESHRTTLTSSWFMQVRRRNAITKDFHSFSKGKLIEVYLWEGAAAK